MIVYFYDYILLLCNPFFFFGDKNKKNVSKFHDSLNEEYWMAKYL